MTKYKFNLVAIDVIDGLDNNFYVIDVNGLIGVQSILKYQYIFHTELRKLFGNFYSLNCLTSFVKDFDLLNEGLNKNSLVVINNDVFKHENKLDWREKYDFASPPITLYRNSSCLEIHNNPDYPKFLTKPNFSFGGMGIELYNELETISNKEDEFIEQYIPNKLIDGHCYHSRLIIITNEDETFPILRLNKLCARPIIRNLKQGILTEEESLSYISNRNDEENPNHFSEKCEKWILNTDDRFEEFSLQLVDIIKSTNEVENPSLIEEIKKSVLHEQSLIDFLSNF